MVKINKSNLHSCLADSKIIHKDFIIEDGEQLEQVLNALRFHMIDDIPYEVFEFMFYHNCEGIIELFKDYHYGLLRTFDRLNSKPKRHLLIPHLIKFGNLKIFKFLAKKGILPKTSLVASYARNYCKQNEIADYLENVYQTNKIH